MDQKFSFETLLGIEAALLAGDLLRQGFGTHFSISSKKEGLHNLVTEYDRRSEQAIIQYIRSHMSSARFLAEESGESGGDTAGTLWVIDPLDGTVNFAHGIPLFSVSIAAVKNKQVLCGIVYNPITRELFVAEKGKGAFCNGQNIAVSKVKELEQTFLSSGFPYRVKENPLGCIDRTADVLHVGPPLRIIGSAALDLAYTASGRFDGFFEVSLAPWDVAAGILIVEEAGGEVSHWDCQSFDCFSYGTILATNGLIHKSLSKILHAAD